MSAGDYNYLKQNQLANSLYQVRYVMCSTCHQAYQQGFGHICPGSQQVTTDWSQYLNVITTSSGAPVNYSGNKPVVICNGQAVEAKDLDEAQSKAEQLAHQHQADAFILKPIKKVAPKREVVTTEL